MHRCAVEAFCPTFKLAAVYSATANTGEGPLLDAIEDKKCKKENEPTFVAGFVVVVAKLMARCNGNQNDQADTFIILILQS